MGKLLSALSVFVIVINRYCRAKLRCFFYRRVWGWLSASKSLKTYCTTWNREWKRKKNASIQLAWRRRNCKWPYRISKNSESHFQNTYFNSSSHWLVHRHHCFLRFFHASSHWLMHRHRFSTLFRAARVGLFPQYPPSSLSCGTRTQTAEIACHRLSQAGELSTSPSLFVYFPSSDIDVLRRKRNKC